MKPMTILWKRLVTDGKTCPRCGDTGRELETAVNKLAAALRPLGIEPVLETQEIDEATFKMNTAESNRVWIAGRPLEDWLGAGVGMSRCCTACGDTDCRTIEMDGRTYEAIPEEQIIKAGLTAASRMIGPSTSELAEAETSCCGGSPGSEPRQSAGFKDGCCG